MKVNVDCEDFLPLKEDEYKIITLKEPNEFCEKIMNEETFCKFLPQLKPDNVLKRITLSYSYFSDINSAYLKEETIFKDILV